MKYLIIILFILIIPDVLGFCDDNQIDINSATAGELDKIIWVGPATAEKIIANRPFESVDDLVDVSGISEGRLSDIKEQGLACAEDSEENKKTGEYVPETEKIINETKNETEEIEPINLEPQILTPINLNPKTIKTENNSETSGRSYAIYGFVGFCILLGFLWLLKIRKNKFEKNEFEK